MSLADELLADFEDENEFPVYDQLPPVPIDEKVVPKIEKTLMKSDSVRQIAKLSESDQLPKVLTQIEKFLATPRRAVNGPLEADPEYRVIVDANDLAVEVDDEICTIHKFVIDKYEKRFSELKSLVLGATEYISTVKQLGNDLEKAKRNEILMQFLTSATIMVINISASTTQGKLLTDQELDIINEACDLGLEMNGYKIRICEYVESRTSFIAPNISIIVGASIAAQLMAAAGGLTKLSTMPACNIMLLGQEKKTLSGFSVTSTLPHTGFVYFCEIVQKTRPDLRRKAVRLVTSKCALAARMDLGRGNDTDGQLGQQLREEIEKKLAKLQEPPPVKRVKGLPAPTEPPKNKRGGKRVRKMKEQLKMTEIRKRQNRMNFADIDGDAYHEVLGFSSEQFVKSGTGRIRAPQVDNKTKVRISKTLQKTLQKDREMYGGRSSIRSEVSGTTSVVFTHNGGLEIVNPNACKWLK